MPWDDQPSYVVTEDPSGQDVTREWGRYRTRREAEVKRGAVRWMFPSLMVFVIEGRV